MSSNPVAAAARSPLTRTSSRLQAPASVKVGPDIAPQLVSFKPIKKAYVVLNSKPHSVTVGALGNMITVPAFDEVFVRPSNMPETDFFLESEIDPDGERIPGSLLIEDVYITDAEGNDVLIFDAERTICHILGVVKTRDGKPSSLASSYAVRGLSLLPRNPPKSLWHRVAQDGEHRAFIASVQDAYYSIAAHDAANARRRQAGDEPLPGGADIAWSRQLIEEYNKMTKTEMAERMAPWKAEADLAEATEEAEIAAEAEAIAMRMAENLAVKHNVDKFELFNRLLDDPKVKAKAIKEYGWRRRGHLKGKGLGEDKSGKPELSPEQLQAALDDLDKETADEPDAPVGDTGGEGTSA